ncbi:transcriptional regulator GntR family [Vibrio variabilis]|uniref:Transcriptional regulator GntR family n=1 Tax=Vibrio variabilis TaxID=990271 RepID=A0ABQ0JNC0_9VIBR|nr:transcriptional regulator GntR family [Vibrio variabilis]
MNKGVKTKIAGQTQDDVVYCHVFDAILEQRLPPATKLSEEALAEIFGVSERLFAVHC